MLDLPGPIGTLIDLLVVIIGFGAIVFVHELGHFLAARWAGIRVLTFAVGFGPALVSWRKGLGWRRGSSEAEYKKLVGAQAAGVTTHEGQATTYHGVSPTEYRLAALPFGGFVRMLGQDDMDPGATSDAPDSYQNCAPWKRLVVISAGVVMNMIMAATLFILVFMVGMKVEPPTIGMIATGLPAEAARATLPDGTETGLEPGDRVVSIDGVKPRRFDAIMMEVATAKPGRPVELVVQREGVPTPITFSITPEASAATGLLDLGVGPEQSLQIAPGEGGSERRVIAELLERGKLVGVEPGATLVRVNDKTDLRGPADVDEAFEQSRGKPVSLAFENPDGTTAEVESDPSPQFEVSKIVLRTGNPVAHVHLLGLAGVLMVNPLADPAQTKQGLAPGDVFARLGALEYPSLPAGIEEIRANAGQDLGVEVLRAREGFEPERVALTVHVSRDGKVGFIASDTSEESGLLSLPVERVEGFERGAEPYTPAAVGTITRPGTRLLAVNGTPVSNLVEARTELMLATEQASAAGTGEEVALRVQLPTPGKPEATLAWSIPAGAVERLHGLSWSPPFSTALFDTEKTVLRAKGPVEAITLGVRETDRVMMKTYLTFARLFEGSVKVEHLKGPVGIAHIGTRIAGRGIIWLLFFLALISVNLAVINFLPLPIVDGGQFLMIVYEQIRGRPVPIPVQNAVTLAGLVLIGGAFLYVTFNDVVSLFGL